MPDNIEKEGQKYIMVDEGAMVRLINTTMMPTLLELKYAVESLKKDLSHYIEIEGSKITSIISESNNLDKRLTILEVMLSGFGEDIGLKGEIAEIKKWIEGRVWLERIVVAAFVVQVMTVIFLLTRSGF